MKGYNRINILGTYVDNLTMDETIEIINLQIQKKQPIHHTVVNAAKIVKLQKDSELKTSVNEADMINADGLAVVWAGRFLGKPIKERVAGIDIFMNLVESAYKNDQSIYLLGATEEVVSKLSNQFKKTYNDKLIAGYRNGYFSKEDESAIINDIVEKKPTMLFVAMSSPKKENFLYKYRNEFKNIGFIMGVGGSFDVIAGKVKRAPVWMQNSGLEWLYRLLQEPRRLYKRYLVDNTLFVVLVLRAYFKKEKA